MSIYFYLFSNTFDTKLRGILSLFPDSSMFSTKQISVSVLYEDTRTGAWWYNNTFPSVWTMPTSVVQPKQNEASKSKLPIPVQVQVEKTTSKIKNFALKSWEGFLEKNPVPEPRMTRSSSLRRANSMKRVQKSSNLGSRETGGSPPALSRCGTGGSLERPSARRSFRKCNLEARGNSSSSTSENNSPK